MNDRSRKDQQEYQSGIVVQQVSRILCPFIIMFGVYLVTHGHLTPGGGFQGGVIISAAFILFALAFNRKKGREMVPGPLLLCGASAGIFLYIGAGLAGVFLGYHFLANKAAGIQPCGMQGELLSGGTLFWINIGVGLAVASIFTDLFYAFLEERRDGAYLKNNRKLPYKRRWSDVDRNSNE